MGFEAPQSIEECEEALASLDFDITTIEAQLTEYASNERTRIMRGSTWFHRASRASRIKKAQRKDCNRIYHALIAEAAHERKQERIKDSNAKTLEDWQAVKAFLKDQHEGVWAECLTILSKRAEAS